MTRLSSLNRHLSLALAVISIVFISATTVMAQSFLSTPDGTRVYVSSVLPQQGDQVEMLADAIILALTDNDKPAPSLSRSAYLQLAQRIIATSSVHRILPDKILLYNALSDVMILFVYGKSGIENIGLTTMDNLGEVIGNTKKDSPLIEFLAAERPRIISDAMVGIREGWLNYRFDYMVQSPEVRKKLSGSIRFFVSSQRQLLTPICEAESKDAFVDLESRSKAKFPMSEDISRSIVLTGIWPISADVYAYFYQDAATARATMVNVVSKTPRGCEVQSSIFWQLMY